MELTQYRNFLAILCISALVALMALLAPTVTTSIDSGVKVNDTPIIIPFEAGTVPDVSAHQSCTDSRIAIYEDFNLTGDGAFICGNWGDLNTAGHGGSGNCDGHILGDNSWDDCVSSWKVFNNVHRYCIGIYGSPSYLPPLLEGGVRLAGYWSNMNSGENNQATSIKFSATSICPTNA